MLVSLSEEEDDGVVAGGLSSPSKVLQKPVPCIATSTCTLFAPPTLPVRISVFPFDA